MIDFDLIDAVRPAGGVYCIAGITNANETIQRFVDTREQLAEKAELFTKQGRNVYFGVAKYGDGDNRTKENVLTLKSFWVDIDCGPGKEKINEKTGRPFGYASQVEGLNALRAFMQVVGLPSPILVDSGRGVHAYWPITEEITREVWEPVGAKLRSLCTMHNFYVDTSVIEVARVMRLPGTFNFRGNPPLPVRVLKAGKPTPLATFIEILGVTEEEMKPKPPKRELTALGKAMQSNVESSFATIMRKCASGAGCLQLMDCYINRATLSEPRWFNALSVAKFCSDRDTAIHKMSEGHPDYSPAAVERKIMGIKGPHTCDELEKNNPGGCEGCPHKGKITSPIVLGKIIARSAPPPPETEEPEDSEEGEEAVAPASTPPVISLPYPYFRGKNGGIYTTIDTNDGPIEEMVYENDLYIVKLMEDPLNGFVAVFRLHLPMDGMKEFVIPNTKISEQAELRRELARSGVMTGGDKFKLIAAYITASIRELQHKRKAELMRVQFGWAERDSAFIVGDREITAHGTHHSPPSSATNSMVSYFQPEGSLEMWKAAFSLYGRPGLEIQAFGALSGFGSPLLKFTGQKGAVINLIHAKSGTGKTTVLRMANSVFGNPELLLGTPDDTKPGRIIKAGLLNNLVNTVDEITNTTPEDVSQLLYAFSQGRGKDKAKANANELRENNTTWRQITLFSSNAHLGDKLSSIKALPDGEMFRMLEFKIDYTSTQIISSEEGKHMFDHVLNHNFGHAGPIFIKWVIENLEEVKQALLDVQAKLDSELKFGSRERNWSAIISANITAGLIARRLGLIDFNMQEIYKRVTAAVRGMLKEMEASFTMSDTDLLGMIGEFVNANINNMLVINDQADARTKRPSQPLVVPKGPLNVRYEPDTKLLSIACKAFRDACVRSQLSYKEVLLGLGNQGVLKAVTTKRLSTGMPVTAPGVRCIILDCSNNKMVDIDALTAGTGDGSGESQLPD